MTKFFRKMACFKSCFSLVSCMLQGKECAASGYVVYKQTMLFFCTSNCWLAVTGSMMFNKFPCVVEPWQPVAEVTTWSSTISFASSPSSCKKHTACALEDGNGGGATKSGEEFCMISGRHSCTLERLYAWEKKLFDEVKASETIRKEYDQKCRLLANSYARDLKSEAIDRTRALVKDLHSQLFVSIQAVDLISKKIEQLRDDELQPQIVELMHGLVLMWKGMLKCHHAQFITISLAYHAKSSIKTVNKTSYMQALMQLYDENH
ncbi:hypothetical protein HPP92_008994 [Vanilla planifolia]|uniref:DUF632 domain-containing protein n=1 Tax=Vanilla planifolia TaxID=51239 RepID=A0A835RDF6_VANPL|nr:hypothetical protein HPP92_008994 [Vanilla planifolia]